MGRPYSCLQRALVWRGTTLWAPLFLEGQGNSQNRATSTPVPAEGKDTHYWGPQAEGRDVAKVGEGGHWSEGGHVVPSQESP